MTTSNIVYVVMDNGSIQGIFTTLGAAEEVVERELGYDIVEWELNRGLVEIRQGLTPWWVKLDLDDESGNSAEEMELGDFSVEVRPYDYFVMVCVWATDEDDAIVQAQKLYKQYPGGYPVVNEIGDDG